MYQGHHTTWKEHENSQGDKDGKDLNIRHSQQNRRNRVVALRLSWFHEFELPQRKEVPDGTLIR